MGRSASTCERLPRACGALLFPSPSDVLSVPPRCPCVAGAGPAPTPRSAIPTGLHAAVPFLVVGIGFLNRFLPLLTTVAGPRGLALSGGGYRGSALPPHPFGDAATRNDRQMSARCLDSTRAEPPSGR